MVTAKGIPYENIPEIRLRASKGMIASFQVRTNTIYIEKEAIKTCFDFASDEEERKSLIAFLIGHELGHFYEKNSEDFLCNGETNPIELKADLEGAMMTRLAGYQLPDIFPGFITRLYEVYNEEIQRHSLCVIPISDRKNMVELANREVERLAALFEVANYLVPFGHYREAREIYSEILGVIQFKELLNNLGALYLYAYLENKKNPITYPILISLTGINRSKESIFFPKKDLLEESLALFKQADLHYEKGFDIITNMAIIYLILHDFFAAEEKISQLEAVIGRKRRRSEHFKS